MATREAILAIKVISDSTQAAAGLDRTAGSAGKFSGAMQKAVAPAIAAGAAVFAIGKKALQSASLLQQSEGAVEAVFGNSADAVKKYAETADTAMGLSAAQYDQYAALVGTALQNAGMSVKDSVEESNKIMQRGADLSALYGGTTAEAVEAINAAVSRSEFDPLEKYGVSLNMTAVNAELAAKGQDKLTGAALDTAKKAIILEQIYGKSSKAAGQFAREADSAAGSAQVASAQWENASAALGTALLPAASAVASQLAKLGEWMQKNSTAAQIVLGSIAALAATVLLLNAAIKTATVIQTVWNAAQRVGSALALGTRIQLIALAAAEKAAAIATKIVTAAQWLWNAALSANPIGLAVIAIALLVAAIVILWKKSETFRKIVTKVWEAVKAGARVAASVLKAVFTAVWQRLGSIVRTYGSIVRAVFNAIRAAINVVSNAVQSLIGKIRNIKVPGSIKSAFEAVKSAADRVRNAVENVISKVRNISVPGAIKSALDSIKSAADRVKSAIDNVISALRSIPVPHINWPSPPGWLDKITGRAAPAPPVRPGGGGGGIAPRVAGFGAPAVSTPTGGGGFIQINVTGAVDPEGVARQINRILEGHSRRVGLRT